MTHRKEAYVGSPFEVWPLNEENEYTILIVTGPLNEGLKSGPSWTKMPQSRRK